MWGMASRLSLGRWRCLLGRTSAAIVQGWQGRQLASSQGVRCVRRDPNRAEEQLGRVDAGFSPSQLAVDDERTCGRHAAGQYGYDGGDLDGFYLESAKVDAKLKVAPGPSLEHLTQRRHRNAEADEESTPEGLYMRTADEHANGDRELLRRICARGGGDGDLCVHLGDQTGGHILKERVDIPDVAIDRASRHARGFGQLADRDLGRASLSKEAQRCLVDPIAS